MHSHLIGQPYFHYMYFISLCAPLALFFFSNSLNMCFGKSVEKSLWHLILKEHQWPNYTVAVFVVIFNLSLICVLILILNIIQSSLINPLYLGVRTHNMEYLRSGTTTLAPPKVPTLTFTTSSHLHITAQHIQLLTLSYSTKFLISFTISPRHVWSLHSHYTNRLWHAYRGSPLPLSIWPTWPTKY